jgi:hypothetical protein
VKVQQVKKILRREKMKVLESQSEIGAPIDVVWQHLTDFASYAEWNPYILSAEGELKQDSLVRFKVAGIPMMLSAPIVSLVENKELIWEARLPFPGVKPRYIRRLEEIDANRTRFINREEFTGWAVPLMSPILNLMSKPLFPKTCAALKQRAEAAVAQSG